MQVIEEELVYLVKIGGLELVDERRLGVGVHGRGGNEKRERSGGIPVREIGEE